MKLMVRSLIVFFVAFAGYQVVLACLPPYWRAGGRAGSQYEQNLMRAQEFLYNAGNPKVVIAGTSIASRLESLPADWFNLAFSGGSTFTALDILAHSRKAPQFVLIETNVLVTRDLDAQMAGDVSNPLLADARRTFPAMLEANKPQHVLERAVDPASSRGFVIYPPGHSHGPVAPASQPGGLATDGGHQLAGTTFPADPPEPEVPVWMRPELYHELVRMQVANAAAPVSEERLRAIVTMMRHYVSTLEARGSTVVFFEAPEHPEVMTQAAARALQTRLKMEFPPSRYAWVPPVDPHEFRTTDGVHLTTPGTIRYCQLLVSTVAGLTSAK
jgi:hypothetical protein